jgi:hypothetical protein
MAQEVEYLLSKCEPLSSTPSIAKKEKKIHFQAKQKHREMRNVEIHLMKISIILGKAHTKQKL